MLSGIASRLSALASDPLGTIVTFLYSAAAILVSLILHECAHGYAALKCGDPTAKWMGRLTLDPRKHLDPVGTLCMIIIAVAANKWIMLPFYMSAFHMDIGGILKFANVDGVDSELKLLLLVTAPFNLLKGVVLSIVTGLIYKPLSPVLHGKIKR